MASLADLVLAGDDGDELELDDEDLAREIEELNALKAAASPAGAMQSRPASAAVPCKTVAVEQECKASLAEKILDAPGGVDDVDREFQAMEQELEEQLLKYREQCQGAESPAAARAPVVPAQDASTTVGSGWTTSFPSRPSSKASGHGKEHSAAAGAGMTETGGSQHSAASNSGMAETGGALETPELVNLREQAVQMDEAFPEPKVVSTQEAPTRLRQRQGLRAGYDGSREPAPEDLAMANLKEQLSSLDCRMGAIQQKNAMHDDLNHATKHELPAAAARAVAELKAQNAHLRERFQSTDRRGLLRLDGSMFGASAEESRGPPKVMLPKVVLSKVTGSSQAHGTAEDELGA